MHSIYKGYKISLYLTESQKTKVDKFINIYRYVYNWGIAEEEKNYELYKEHKVPYGHLSFYDLSLRFTQFKKQPNNQWLKELPFGTARNALKDVSVAYERFFKGISRHPGFKSRKRSTNMSFKPRLNRFYIDGDKARIEGFAVGEKLQLGFNTNRYKSENIKYYDAVVKRDNLGNYWLGFEMKKDVALSSIAPIYEKAIGIDLGIRTFATLSTGEKFNVPNVDKYKKKVKKLQRQCQKDINKRKKLERTNPGVDISDSKNAQKRRYKLRKYQNKIKNIYRNFRDTLSKQLVMRNPKAIVMENLDVKHMYKKRYNSTHLNDLAFFDFRYRVQYKSEKYTVPFILAPRDYKSTQICSNCGCVNKIGAKHIYKCEYCGSTIDRDLNASINLENLAY